MRRLSLLLILLVCAFGAGASSARERSSAPQARKLRVPDELTALVVALERRTWDWQRLVGSRPTPTAGRDLRELSANDRAAAVSLWRARALQAARVAQHPPHLQAWLCIHRYEGSWTDGGAPYWGGLQMDLGFQAHYGAGLLARKGTADHWTPLEQMWTAERALRAGAGFGAWPNSARLCGLI